MSTREPISALAGWFPDLEPTTPSSGSRLPTRAKRRGYVAAPKRGRRERGVARNGSRVTPWSPSYVPED